MQRRKKLILLFSFFISLYLIGCGEDENKNNNSTDITTQETSSNQEGDSTSDTTPDSKPNPEQKPIPEPEPQAILWNYQNGDDLKGVNIVTAKGGKEFHPSEDWSWRGRIGQNQIETLGNDRRTITKVVPYHWAWSTIGKSLVMTTQFRKRFADGTLIEERSGFTARQTSIVSVDEKLMDKEGNEIPSTWSFSDRIPSSDTTVNVTYDLENIPLVTISYKVVDPKLSGYQQGDIYKKLVKKYEKNPLLGRYTNDMADGWAGWLEHGEPHSNIYLSQEVEYLLKNGEYVKSSEKKWDSVVDSSTSLVTVTYTYTDQDGNLLDLYDCDNDDSRCAKKITTYDLITPSMTYVVMEKVFSKKDPATPIRVHTNKFFYRDYELGILSKTTALTTDGAGNNGYYMEQLYDESGITTSVSRYQVLDGENLLRFGNEWVHNDFGNAIKSKSLDNNGNITSYSEMEYDSMERLVKAIRFQQATNDNPTFYIVEKRLNRYETAENGERTFITETYFCQQVQNEEDCEDTPTDKRAYTYNLRGQKVLHQEYSRDDQGQLNLTQQLKYVYAENGTRIKIEDYDPVYNASFETSKMTLTEYVEYEYDENLFRTSRKIFYATGELCSGSVENDFGPQSETAVSEVHCNSLCKVGSYCYTTSVNQYR